MAAEPIELLVQVGRVDAGQVQDRRRQVDRRAQRGAAAAAVDVRVADDQRDVEVLVVDQVALLPQAVGAGQLAVGGASVASNPGAAALSRVSIRTARGPPTGRPRSVDRRGGRTTV
jgi:hypothetical protein